VRVEGPLILACGYTISRPGQQPDLDSLEDRVEATPESDARKPAHRPSRRHELVQAAVAVFARKGYAESSVEDVAEEAGVVPTAIYYHFGTKEELLYQALKSAMDQFSEAILETRSAGQPADADVLRRVIKTGWQWWESHPDESMLIGRYSQSTTGQALELRGEWEERHRSRAYDYLPGANTSRTGRAAREQHAVNTLRIRALLDIILAAEAAALPGGALADYSAGDLSDELAEVCVRLMSA
jgi:AcrR family transcriptional regulator